MGKAKGKALFNLIAPVYRLFYHKQKVLFAQVVNSLAPELDVAAYASILDVGCGTGALCAVLYAKGLKVTGVDTAEKMLSAAEGNTENKGVTFLQADAGEGLPFADKSFDVSIASYVAHGMGREERKRLYAEMSRVSKYKVIIYDYNQRRRWSTTMIEWLERGDYFHFIKNAETEMQRCVEEMGACFHSVRVVNADAYAAWYICDPL